MQKVGSKKKLKIPKEYKYIGAFLTMRCNLHCSYCNNDFYGKLEDIHRYPLRSLGEP